MRWAFCGKLGKEIAVESGWAVSVGFGKGRGEVLFILEEI